MARARNAHEATSGRPVRGSSASPSDPIVRPAHVDDAEAIARIHNQGIGERIATFQTTPRRAADVASAVERGPVLVAERGVEVVGWAAISPYDDAHDYYAGVGEATLYVEQAARGSGAGRAMLEALTATAERHGYYKLVGKILSSNRPSVALVRSCGWREVGLHRRHGRLDGEWKDVLVVELLLGDARGTDRPRRGEAVRP
jgi:L-amino acid N-acyltransferase YncA